MTDEQKGKELIDALTARMRYELDSTFGWTANDILLNPYVLDNRAYRQFGTYYATKTLLDHYSTVIAKLGSSDRENQNLYDARVNDFTFGPKRWGYFFIPSAESAYKRGLKRVDSYKQELTRARPYTTAEPTIFIPPSTLFWVRASSVMRSACWKTARAFPSTRWTTASMRPRESCW